MAPNKNNGTSIARNNHNGGSGTRQVLKKGPWTAMEDAILTEYVKKHGEGNWNAVQRNSGLMRCGKSCRLRWANHLRPHLKKGAFSLEEEWLIVELHAKLGNKWARMAAQGSLGVTGKVVANPCDQKVMGLSRKNSLLQKCELPGRTDNEIKNYWNTRLKRRQRAGLPIYPQDIQPQNYQQENQQQHSTNIPSPFDNHKNSNYNNNSPLSLLDIFNPSTMKPSTNISSHPYQFNNNPSPFLTTTNNINNQVKFFRDPRISLSLTLTSSMKNSQHSSMVRPVPNNFSQGYSSSMPASSQLQHSYPNFSTTTRPFSGVSSNPNGLILGMGTEHRSVRMSVPETTTSSDADNYAVDYGLSRGNSGLLEDLLEESQTLTRAEKIEENCSIEKEDNKGKLVWEEYGLTEEAADAILTEESTYNFAHGDDDDATQNNHSEESSPLNSSSGITTKEASLEPGNQVDDDIMRFLDNFPLGVPVPDWCDDDQNHHDQQNTSNAQSFECDQIQLSKLI